MLAFLSMDQLVLYYYLEVWHKILTIDCAIKPFARSIVQRRTVLISMAYIHPVHNFVHHEEFEAFVRSLLDILDQPGTC